MSRGKDGGSHGSQSYLLARLERVERDMEVLLRERVVVRVCRQCLYGYKVNTKTGEFLRDADRDLIPCNICNGRGEHLYRVHDLPVLDETPVDDRDQDGGR